MWYLPRVHIYFLSHKQNTLFLHLWFWVLYFYSYRELNFHFRPKLHNGIKDHIPSCYHSCYIIIMCYGPEITTMLCKTFVSKFSWIQILTLDIHFVSSQTSFLGFLYSLLSDACSILPLPLLPIFISSLICSIVLSPSNGIVIYLFFWLSMCFSSVAW